jgi:hypothetical protein
MVGALSLAMAAKTDRRESSALRGLAEEFFQPDRSDSDEHRNNPSREDRGSLESNLGKTLPVCSCYSYFNGKS